MTDADDPTAVELVLAAAAMLVSAVPLRAIRRGDGTADRITVSRSQLLRLAEALDTGFPGLVDRVRPRALADRARGEADAARRTLTR